MIEKNSQHNKQHNKQHTEYSGYGDSSRKNLQGTKIGRLIDLIESSSSITAFTGAGVSTLSGVRDFRGKNGLYNDEDADRIFDGEWFRRDPSIYYRAAKELIYGLDRLQPSIVHRVLAAMEQAGKLNGGVITQNIDLLHERAGSRKIMEIHGSPFYHHCMSCGKRYTFDEVIPKVRKDTVPHCDECGGVLKPEITFFGESLPQKALSDAVDSASRADLLLVLGSTLLVQPAASLPMYTLRNGGRVVIINNMSTPIDMYAELLLYDLQEVFEVLAESFLP